MSHPDFDPAYVFSHHAPTPGEARPLRRDSRGRAAIRRGDPRPHPAVVGPGGGAAAAPREHDDGERRDRARRPPHEVESPGVVAHALRRPERVTDLPLARRPRLRQTLVPSCDSRAVAFACSRPRWVFLELLARGSLRTPARTATSTPLGRRRSADGADAAVRHRCAREVTRRACGYDVGSLAIETQGASAPDGAKIPIDTIVIVMMENRSFDHYFQDCLTPGWPRGRQPTARPRRRRRPGRRDQPGHRRHAGPPAARHAALLRRHEPWVGRHAPGDQRRQDGRLRRRQRRHARRPDARSA